MSNKRGLCAFSPGFLGQAAQREMHAMLEGEAGSLSLPGEVSNDL